MSDPENGAVSTTGTGVGDTATYTCNSGFEISGSDTRTCQSNGEWSGSTPTCEVKSTGILSTDIQCPALSDPDNGVVGTTGTRVGDTATYTCNSGYELSTSDTQTCQSNGEWSGSAPTCEGIQSYSYYLLDNDYKIILAVQCPALSNPENGAVSITGTGVSDTATYTCNDGYEISGSDTQTCQLNGKWSGSPPICEIKSVGIISTDVQCPALSDPENGAVSTTGTEIGDTATYTCNSGYELSGSDSRTCQLNGEWSGSAPTCEGKYYTVAKQDIIDFSSSMS